MARTVLPVLGLLVLASGAAQAVGNTSVYTEFDTKRCRKVTQPKDPISQGAWICPGHGKQQVRLEVADERMAVTFGTGGAKETPVFETFPAFNDVYAGRIEWRLKAGSAFATGFQVRAG